MKRLPLVVCSLLGLVCVVLGLPQNASSLPPQAKPSVIPSLKQDTSRALREVPPLPPSARPNVHEIARYHLPKAKGPDFPASGLQAVDPVLQSGAGGLTMPSTDRNFEGIGNVNSVLPPDTNGDVGPNHYVQWVNLSFAIWNKNGTLLYGPADGNTLWLGFGAPCETTNDGDPIVLYDPLADRWLMSQFVMPNFPYGPFYQCLAVSQTPDPTGAWYRYAFKVSDTKLNDYPKFGVWPDGYYMTVNQFGQGVYLPWAGQGVVAFERDKMLAGLPAQMVYFDLYWVDPYLGGLLPADLDGLTPPPPGSPNYLVTFDDDAWGYSPDRLQIWQLQPDWSQPLLSSLSGPVILTPASFDSNLCGYARNCIPQPGTNSKLDALSDRLMYRLAYRNFGTHQSLVLNQTVDVDGANHAGIRWYEIRNPGGPPTLYQQGTYAPDSDHRWMGSIAMDASGNIALGYSVSGGNRYPSIRFTGRLSTDPLGTLPQGENELIAGTGSQTSLSYRWGDYSMLGVDPSDDCTFWYTQEYYATTSNSSWRTRIGSFRFPSCSTVVSGVDLSLTKTDAPDPVTVGNAVSYLLAVSNAGTDNATGVTLSDTLPAGLTFVSVSSSQGICSAGGNPIVCNLGDLSGGAGATVTITGIPSSAGTLVNTAAVSGNEADPNPANNTATATTTALVAGVDLIETSVSNPPGTAAVGSSFSVSDTVYNQGDTASGASTTRFYLSTDSSRDGADVLLTGSRSVPGIAGGSTSSGTTTVTIASTTPIGAYFLLACADDTLAVTESDEANNCAASGTVIQVTGLPDLVVTSLTNPPAAQNIGTKFNVTDTTKNQGTSMAAASTTRYYLSLDQAWNSGDLLLSGSRSIPSLAAGGSSTGTASVTIPAKTALGTYYLLGCADDQKKVTEGNETNNCAASSATILVTAPDLIVSSISDPPASQALGTSLSVTDTTMNVGTGTAGASTTRYYLSTDQSWSSADVLLTGTRSVGTLSPGASSTATVTVTIPTATPLGTYYLLACSDDLKKVTESNEKNNCKASGGRVTVY